MKTNKPVASTATAGSSSSPTAQPGRSANPGRKASDVVAYSNMIASAGGPLLGYIVLYSVYHSEVTPDELRVWFADLDLDSRLIPPRLKSADAYRKAVSHHKRSLNAYRIDATDSSPGGAPHGGNVDPTTAAAAPGSGDADAQGRTVTLMLRLARSDARMIVHHLVREVRNESAIHLAYDTPLAECVFKYDHNATAPGEGSLHIHLNRREVAKLPTIEQDHVTAALAALEADWTWNRTHLSTDQIRGIIRGSLATLHPLPILPSGSAYFVRAEYTETLGKIREIVARLSPPSKLDRIPIVNQQEMRDMVLAAFTTKTTADIVQLSEQITFAQQHGSVGARTKGRLTTQYQELCREAEKHSTLLSTSLIATETGLDAVRAQLRTLLGAEPVPTV